MPYLDHVMLITSQVKEDGLGSDARMNTMWWVPLPSIYFIYSFTLPHSCFFLSIARHHPKALSQLSLCLRKHRDSVVMRGTGSGVRGSSGFGALWRPRQSQLRLPPAQSLPAAEGRTAPLFSHGLRASHTRRNFFPMGTGRQATCWSL